MTSWRVLRLLAVILLVVSWFLVAWTAAVCERPDRTWALIGVGYTPDGLQFSMCLLDRWDYMTAVGKNPPPPGSRQVCQVGWRWGRGGRWRVPLAGLRLLTRKLLRKQMVPPPPRHTAPAGRSRDVTSC